MKNWSVLINFRMDSQQALDKLFSLHQFGVKLGLENISNLCSYIDNPEKKLSTFHIAGSNGKGSTASFMASILQEAGYKVGLFTSPHFVSFTERIRINGEMIPLEYVRDFMNDLNLYIDKNSPTFFELTTAMAFKYFAEKEVDFSVVETGLGGRLDATNVLKPIASIITSISHEHGHILGDTLEKIAYEKAGIIKSGSKVFISKLPENAESVIREISEQRNSEFFSLMEFVTESDDGISIRIKDDSINFYSIPLKGEYQFYNVSLAALTLLESINSIKSSDIINGITNVKENSGIWGRYEVYSESPRVIFDAAHNFEGVENFLSEFKSEAERYSKRTLMFGAMKDKNIEAILKRLSIFFDDIVVTSISYERAASIEELENIVKSIGVGCTVTASPAKYIKEFLSAGNGQCLVILGSIYVIGEIKKELS